MNSLFFEKNPNWRIRYGFSLVELLVVMAIISILAGMLLPLLAKARASAQVVGCFNNLKQIGLAMTQYNEENGVVPSIAACSDEFPPYQHWHKYLVKAGCIEGKTYSGYDGAEGEVFCCPAKKTKISRPARQNAHFASDYALNVYYCNSHMWLPLKKIKKTSSVYFIGEKPPLWDNTRQRWAPDPVQYLHPNSYDKYAHSGITTMLFFDMHVKPMDAYAPYNLYIQNPGGSPWKDQ